MGDYSSLLDIALITNPPPRSSGIFISLLAIVEFAYSRLFTKCHSTSHLRDDSMRVIAFDKVVWIVLIFPFVGECFAFR